MASKGGSRFILGHVGYTEIANLHEGQEAVIVLNPAEPKARFEVSKNIKGVFSRRGRSCEVSTQMILIEHEPGSFKQGQILTIRPRGNPAGHEGSNVSEQHEFDEDEGDQQIKLDDCVASAIALRDQMQRFQADASPLQGELINPELQKVSEICRMLNKWSSMLEPGGDR